MIKLIKKILPATLIQKLRQMKARHLHNARARALNLDPWVGNFSSIAEANRSLGSGGYIQNKTSFVDYTRSCARKGGYFEHETKDIHVLSGLLWASRQIDPVPPRKLRVLDFGGGLGN